MKLRSYVVLSVAVAGFGLFAFAEDKRGASDKDKAPAPDEAEMMKRWEEAATPSAAHKVLDPLVGEWNVATKFWTAADQPPIENKGTVTTKWILGGRFLQEDFSGEMMGKPMKGMGLTGYDNVKKKYNSFWVDESSTAMYTTEGDASADGKVITFMGKMDDVMTGEKNKAFKFVVRIVSADKHIFEMFDMSKDKGMKVVETVYTKK